MILVDYCRRVGQATSTEPHGLAGHMTRINWYPLRRLNFLEIEKGPPNILAVCGRDFLRGRFCMRLGLRRDADETRQFLWVEAHLVPGSSRLMGASATRTVPPADTGMPASSVPALGPSQGEAQAWVADVLELMEAVAHFRVSRGEKDKNEKKNGNSKSEKKSWRRGSASSSSRSSSSRSIGRAPSLKVVAPSATKRELCSRTLAQATCSGSRGGPAWSTFWTGTQGRWRRIS